jgi:DNA-binding MltR family transcriptional regulator
MTLDMDTSRFHRAKNKAKALDSLHGLCSGLVADQIISDVELLFLDVWLKENRALHNDPDVFDLMDALSCVLEKTEIHQEELDDLKTLIEDILHYRKGDAISDSEGLNHLLGVVQGIMADCILCDEEVFSLKAYLDRSEVSSVWPASELHQRLKEVLADGVIDETERHDLTVMLQALSSDFTGTGSAAPKVIELGLDKDVEIIYPEKVFCFTGVFAFGKRSRCVSEVEARQALFSKGVTRKTDYLVLGAFVAPDWQYTSFGRKLQKALDYRSRFNQDIKLISERDWLSSILT